MVEQWEKPKVTNTDVFSKREITFGSDWARMIAAREPGLRAIS